MLAKTIHKIREYAYNIGLEQRAKAKKFYFYGAPQTHVETPTGTLMFFDEQRARAWAKHLPHARIYTVDNGLADPATMDWLMQQRAHGMNTGPLHGRIQQSHPESFDAMVAWFSREPDPRAALDLLKYAFALERPDACASIAQWAQHHPNGWFDPKKLVSKRLDDYAPEDDVDAVCLFGHLMAEPDLMAWLFEHEHSMKIEMQASQHWNALQTALSTLDPLKTVYWPAAAHKAFNVNVDPLQEHERLDDIGFLCRAIAAYNHDPAAQSYFVHRCTTTSVTDLLVEHACADVIELHHRCQLACDPHHIRPKDTPAYDNEKVENLMLGVHLGLDNHDFYYHAKTVFEPTPALKAPVNYPDIDASIF